MDDETPEGDNAVLVGTSQAGDDSTAREGATQSKADDEPKGRTPDNARGTGISTHEKTASDDPDGDEPDPDSDEPDGDEPDDDKPEISRARQQAARYRRQLRDVESERDELAAALWTERVAALGVLADPTDLPHDPDALHDPDRLRELADELVAAKPHLRSRRIRERAGQGEGDGSGTVSLSGLLRRNA